MDVEGLKEDLRQARIFFSRMFPFMAIPLSYMRIIAVPKLPNAYAGVTPKGVLAISMEDWAELGREHKRWVFFHEVLHLVLQHPFRCERLGKEEKPLFNFAGDGKTNHLISYSNLSGYLQPPKDIVTLQRISSIVKVPVETLEQMSVEEIFNLVRKHVETVEVTVDLLEEELDGAVVQEGDPALGAGEKQEEVKRRWAEITRTALSYAKMAGTLPAEFERGISEIFEVKPPWQITLRMGIRTCEKQDSSFAYPSRRGDQYPGPLGYKYSVWCLVDTSGSISEPLLRQFLGIVKHEARNAFEVYCVAWDAEAYDILKAHNPGEVARKIAGKMKGGGGTVILPTLKKACRLVRPGDAVIILTDGDISDKGSEETRQWFRRLAAKAGFAMLGYTDTPVPAPGFTGRHLILSEA